MKQLYRTRLYCRAPPLWPSLRRLPCPAYLQVNSLGKWKTALQVGDACLLHCLLLSYRCCLQGRSHDAGLCYYCLPPPLFPRCRCTVTWPLTHFEPALHPSAASPQMVAMSALLLLRNADHLLGDEPLRKWRHDACRSAECSASQPAAAVQYNCSWQLQLAAGRLCVCTLLQMSKTAGRAAATAAALCMVPPLQLTEAAALHCALSFVQCWSGCTLPPGWPG